MAKQPKEGKPEPRATKRGEAAPRTSRRGDAEDRLVDAMLDLAAARGWRALGLADIAQAAGVPFAELYPAYPSKASILVAFIRRVDRQVLAAPFKFAPEDSQRDRLFEVLMRRFDALQPHREAVRGIRRDLTRAPAEGAAYLPILCRSMAWMLEAADVSSDGPVGQLKALGLTGVWLRTLAAWLDDDTTDLARTMAALDRNLGRAGRCARILFPRERAPRREAA